MPEDTIGRDEVNKLMEKYREELSQQLGQPIDEEYSSDDSKPETSDFLSFRKEILPAHMTIYEKYCNIAEKTLHISPDPNSAARIQNALNNCHLHCTPAGVSSFAILFPATVAFFGILLSFFLFQGSMFMIIFFIAFAGMMYNPVKNIPFFMENTWRMKTANQMVLSIFYIVSYMRHTSNLELAIEFAAKHLSPPISLDFKKILWDVETEKFESIKESLDNYLEGWRATNMEFIEAMHLIESSLYESSEDRRLTMLEKSLTVILEETYEKMLHYAQNLGGPMTMLNMLGVIMPILGLVILPLVVSFMGGVQWYHISSLYNLLLPASIFYMGKKILSTRPGGSGGTDLSEDPSLKKLSKFDINLGGLKLSLDPLMISIIVGAIFLIIGFSPLIMHLIGMPDIGFGGKDTACNGEPCTSCGQKFCLLEYKDSQDLRDPVTNDPIKIGPFGMGASLLSVFAVFGLGLSIGLYYKLKSKNILEIRERSKKLEDEFASSLFQLGNRLGDGIPTEMAFGRVAETMEGTVSGKFFEAVSQNIQRLGMSVDDAIFNKHHGALQQFPSPMIESSMKVLTESAKKGPKIAAEALMNISQYIKQIHTVDERLKDLLSETLSSMKSQIKFLTPVIAGIVIGITSMIIGILSKLGTQMKTIGNQAGAMAGGGLMGMFSDGMPTFYFQIIVGIYVVQIIYILTILANGIENGVDKVGEHYSLGSNMIYGPTLYSFLALAIMVAFNFVAAAVLNK